MTKKLNIIIGDKDHEAIKAAGIHNVWTDTAIRDVKIVTGSVGSFISQWSLRQKGLIGDENEQVKYIIVEGLGDALSNTDVASIDLVDELLNYVLPVPFGTVLFGYEPKSNRRFILTHGRLGNIMIIDMLANPQVHVAAVAEKMFKFGYGDSGALTGHDVTRLTNLNRALESWLKVAHEEGRAQLNASEDHIDTAIQE